MCNKSYYNGKRYTSCLNSITKHCDYCIKTVDGNFELIEHFVNNDEVVYVIFKKITKLLDCFLDPLYPQPKSKIFLCRLTDQTLVTTIDKITKVFSINVSEYKMFILKLSHHVLKSCFFLYVNMNKWLVVKVSIFTLF
jgi:hypothetical protein